MRATMISSAALQGLFGSAPARAAACLTVDKDPDTIHPSAVIRQYLR